MNKKLIAYIMLSICCMTAIFYFSNKNKVQSNSTSKTIIKYFVNIYEDISNKKVNKEELTNKLNYPIRKLAHFSIYFLLGIFVYNIFLLTNTKHKLLLSIIFCILYAIGDETHQLFVSGRTSQPLDVFIDSMGSIISISITKLRKEFVYEKNYKK